MQRILLIGSGGAGKSTLARELGSRLKIEVIHLDALFWKAGWEKPPPEDWLEIVEKAIQGESWIMDGNYSGTLDLRLERADTIIFLDYPRLLCLYRIIKRWLKYRGQIRPDMSEGCNEKLDWEFIMWVWTYRKRNRAKVLQRLRSLQNEKNVVILRHPGETTKFLKSVGGR